ncbi:MAG: hypothetical protein JEZ00_17080 [Anaerolineaceae bacterium]|nr:hypothetical protein [Anaerolineaceae bacterium]
MAHIITAASVKKAIVYYYLLSYCLPERIGELYTNLADYRKQLAASSGMNEDMFFAAVIPEVCKRIVAFHKDSREPDHEEVGALINAMTKAQESPQDAQVFQEQMNIVAGLPQRAVPDNRLHRKKGCAFCLEPCQYGFFTLVSDPDFDVLKNLLEAEIKRDRETQSAIRPIWFFTSTHLSQVMHLEEEHLMNTRHLGNLSYCLLMLAMAKSRLALPEENLQIYQSINQQRITHLKA